MVRPHRYAHIPHYETNGEFYFVVVDYFVLSMAASNVILGLYLVAQKLYGYALLVAPLPCIVYQFSIFSADAHATPCSAVPLDELASLSAEVDVGAFDEEHYRQPALRRD